MPRTITIPDPTAADLHLHVDRIGGLLRVTVRYSSGVPDAPMYEAVFEDGELPAAWKTRVGDFCAAVLNAAKTRMGF